MKKQAFNPYLPSYEYVPDGEPYVFGDRIYVYGSHDAFNGTDFCVNDYVCYSAQIEDLGNWRYEGIIFKSEQDPLSGGKHRSMNAPDVEKGKDGKYYLFFQLAMETVITVAVSDVPQGPFAFYGHVQHPDGTLYGKKKGDAYNFDPSVFTDDDGKIYLYTGSSSDSRLFRFLMKVGGGVVDYGTVLQLEQDMLTVVEGTQHKTIPGMIPAAKNDFKGHGFYEASSVRKINGIYYFVYSSVLSHELCYATGESPIGPWKYGGTIVSIGDIGIDNITEKNARNFLGNTHGGMVCIKGQWYIFYHRQTNQQICARQGCAEPITIEEDGKIQQVEMTSCGLNGAPLIGNGTYEARIACNLYGKDGVFKYTKKQNAKVTDYPYFTQSGSDREDSPDQYISNMREGSVAGFKYFDVQTPVNQISVKVRGNAEGQFLVRISESGNYVGAISVKSEKDWTTYKGNVRIPCGVYPLYFEYKGTGACDLLEFTME